MGTSVRRKVLSCLSVALISWYFATTRVPEGISQPWLTRTILTVTRFTELVCGISTNFGFDEVNILRFVTKLDPRWYRNDSLVHFKDIEMGGVPVRLFMPANMKEQPTRGVMFYHGGGWSQWNPNIYHDVTYAMALSLGAVVASVDYRLAPEHVFPAGFVDCVNAAKHFIKHAHKYNVDPERIVLIGDSAGGNLAAAVSLHLRDEKFHPLPKMQVLVYPFLQATDFNTPSMQYNAHGPLVTKRLALHYKSTYVFGSYEHASVFEINNHTSPQHKAYARETYLDLDVLPKDNIMSSYRNMYHDIGSTDYWEQYEELFMNPYLCPLHGDNFVGLPHAYISTCQHDVFRDDGYFYANKLQNHGVKVTHKNLRVCFHGWINFVDALDTSKEHLDDIVSYIAEHV